MQWPARFAFSAIGLATAGLVASVWAEWPAPQAGQSGLSQVVIDYPKHESLFPPDFAPPTFRWRDPVESASSWTIEITFSNGSAPLHLRVPGDRMQVGEIDPRCISPTNKLPELTSEQAAARIWQPAPEVWEAIKQGSIEKSATVMVTGYAAGKPVSRGRMTLATSKDPVGAPIFYRDVPLMPSELQPGVIKPLSPKLLPYLAWRLRYVDEPRSKVMMEGLHTCANCHSFSSDGSTFGIDMDGPHNDKGLYAIVPVQPKMTVRTEDMISWKNFRGQMERDKRIGFMSQVSPDGRYVITATQVEYYVANFTDYRFLQVFYPTRGILAWYDRKDGQIRPLPGADDPQFVQSNAVWSPDGKYLVLVRAKAADAYPKGRPMATYANDPNEPQIRYDIYRIPFNEGRGGTPEPLRGASQNGMSNSFPRVSPDGKWVVFVQAKNGQLMRPDGQLYIVPAGGGAARLMRANTARMNSWHSFSPNARWMVFSSKSESPYTQMFLTHIDEKGNDSPAILIEDSTAANRAVNIPEFVNIRRGGMEKIDTSAVEFYRLYDLAYDLTEKGRVDEAIVAWRKALDLEPKDGRALNNLGGLLLRQGKFEEAERHLRRAIESDPDVASAYDNLALILSRRGEISQAIGLWNKAIQLDPLSLEAQTNLAGALLLAGRQADAVLHLREALRIDSTRVPVLTNLAWVLATCPDSSVRNGTDAVELAKKAVGLSKGNDPIALDVLGAGYAETGRFAEAIESVQKAIDLVKDQADRQFLTDLEARLSLYRSGKSFREAK
ncbi:MAG TPA: tetratricopeptide repeat protein [Bryobacteraceae bacterium]|nr:tetratricopeptide repeat protein [Bryobacteraceae bacterium]